MSQFTPSWKKLAQLPGKMRRRLQAHGVRDCGAWCCYQFAWRCREWRMGIDTREFAHGVVVDDHGVCHGYEPIDHRCLDTILDYLGDPREQVFVDYGCGMGRAVLMAAARPFRRVLGVELDARLASIAEQQVARARRRGKLRCAEVQVLQRDAATWPVPHDVTCVFLFNSFTGDLLATVLEQIRESLEQSPRPLKLVYVQPVADHDTLADCSWLEQRASLPTGFWSHVRTVVYEPRLGAGAGDGGRKQPTADSR